MGNQPLNERALAVLQNLDPRSKALMLTGLALGGKDAKAHFATNMMFAEPGLMPADIVPGIIAANNCGEWMDQLISDGEDIDFAEHLRFCTSYIEEETCDCEWEQGTTLIGDWKEVTTFYKNGKEVPEGTKGAKAKTEWVHDEEGSEGFAGIWSSSTYDITVVWSKFVYRGGRWCSPCAPGQASIPHGGESFDPDTDGVVCYILPHELHLCFECHEFERPTVWAPGYYGAVLCAVCCERHGVDFKTGDLKESTNEAK